MPSVEVTTPLGSFDYGSASAVSKKNAGAAVGPVRYSGQCFLTDYQDPVMAHLDEPMGRYQAIYETRTCGI